jgi:hypothetical protein
MEGMYTGFEAGVRRPGVLGTTGYLPNRNPLSK